MRKALLLLVFVISCSDGQEDIIVRDVILSDVSSNEPGDSSLNSNESSDNSSSSEGNSQDNSQNSSDNSNSSENEETNSNSNENNNSQNNNQESNNIELEGNLARGNIFQNNIYLTSENKIYKSEDFGLNWSELITVEDYINDIEILNDEVFFFSTNNSKIYKTTNGGLTFESIYIPVYISNNKSINAIEIVDDYLYAIRTRETYHGALMALTDFSSNYFGFMLELYKFDMNLNQLGKSTTGISSFNILGLENQLIIANRSRINIYDKNNLERISSYKYRPGYGQEFILKIIETDNFILGTGKGAWISSDNGISFTEKTLSITGDIYSSTIDDEGNIYLVGENGLLAISDANLETLRIIQTNTEENLYFVGILDNKIFVSGSNAYFNTFILD